MRRYEAVTTSNVELLGEPGPVKERVRQLLMRIVEDELGDVRRRGCLVANATLELAGRDEAVAELVAHNFLRLQTALEKLIARSQQAGEIAADKNPRALARFTSTRTTAAMQAPGKRWPRPASRSSRTLA